MYNEVKKRLEVKTPLGLLCAEIGGEPVQYPEIYIYLEREDGIQIDLTAAGVDVTELFAKVYNYKDTGVDYWTDSFELTPEQINIGA